MGNSRIPRPEKIVEIANLCYGRDFFFKIIYPHKINEISSDLLLLTCCFD